jgi:hypothetical protein
MRRHARFLPAVAVALVALVANVRAATNLPFPNEKLDYNINWPSGLSLGEAHWQAKNIGSAQSPVWDLDLRFDARIPGFTLINSYHAVTTGNYCMDQLTREIEHGSRKTTEKETVDQKTLTVTRKTTSNSGGESTFTVPDCVRDALTFVFLTRHELLSGRIPPNQTVLLGSKYDVHLTYLGSQKIKSGEAMVDADRVGCDIIGPASKQSVEIDFARDSVRTPVLVRVPLTMGTFSLELAR